jgi:hypothetical protein
MALIGPVISGTYAFGTRLHTNASSALALLGDRLRVNKKSAAGFDRAWIWVGCCCPNGQRTVIFARSHRGLSCFGVG